LLRKYGLGRSQAYEAMAVAKAFPSRDEAIELGFAKAAAILHYASATRKPDLPQLITQSGRLGGKRLADMSARDIDAENYALISRIALMMLKRSPERLSLNLKRKKAGWDRDYMSRLLIGGI
jgi:hypothetical protein